MGQIEVHVTDPAEYAYRVRQAQIVADTTGRSVHVYPELNGFSDDARKAITVAPGYFMAWYTVKSIGLCAAVAALAFVLGRVSVRR